MVRVAVEGRIYNVDEDQVPEWTDLGAVVVKGQGYRAPRKTPAKKSAPKKSSK